MERSATPLHIRLQHVAQLARAELPPSQSPTQQPPAPTPTPAPAPSSSRSSKSQSNAPLRWTELMETTLVQSIVDAVNRGLRADSGYKREVWTTAAAEVTRVSGVAVDNARCKVKLSALKRDYKAWVELINQSGFEVGDDRLITGDPGALKTYFDAHKDARKFRYTYLHNEAQLRVLFDGVLATGQEALSVDEIIGSDELVESVESTESVELEDDYSDLRNRTPVRRKRVAPTSSYRVRESKKSTATDRLSQHLDGISDHIGGLTATFRDNQSEALKLFMSGFGVLPYTILDTLVNQFSDEFTSKKFVAFTPINRKKWVRKMLMDRRNELSLEEYDGRSFDVLIEAIEWDGDGVLVLRS